MMLTWKMVEFKTDAMARLAGKGYQGPTRWGGSVENPERASLRPSHLRVIFPAPTRNREYGGWIPKTPSFGRMALDATYLFAYR